MQAVEFKLKQASAVLGVSAKDLQNLVQLKVIRPERRDNIYWFDRRLLLEAKVAFYLKESIGSSSELLSLFTETLSRSLGTGDPRKRRYVLLRSRPLRGAQSVEIKIPVGSLARELEEQLPQAQERPDLVRGRRRAGWQAEIRQALEAASKQMGEVPPEKLRETLGEYRSGRKMLPEVTVVDNTTLRTA
jgi:hypothetical protein